MWRGKHDPRSHSYPVLLRPAVQAGLLLPLIPQHTPLPTPTPTILLIRAPARLTGIEVLFPWCPWLSQGLPACLFSQKREHRVTMWGPKDPAKTHSPSSPSPGLTHPICQSSSLCIPWGSQTTLQGKMRAEGHKQLP